MEVFGELKNAYLEKDNAGKTALGAICCGDNITSEFGPLLTATPKVSIGNGVASKRLIVSDELASVKSSLESADTVLDGRVSSIEAFTARTQVTRKSIAYPVYSVTDGFAGSISVDGKILTKSGTYDSVTLVGAVEISDAMLPSLIHDGLYEVAITAASGAICSKSLNVGTGVRTIENDCGLEILTLGIANPSNSYMASVSANTSPAFCMLDSGMMTSGNVTYRLRVAVASGTITSAYLFKPLDSTTVPIAAGSTIRARATYFGPSAYREITVGVASGSAIAINLYFNKL